MSQKQIFFIKYYILNTKYYVKMWLENKHRDRTVKLKDRDRTVKLNCSEHCCSIYQITNLHGLQLIVIPA
jgi:hypothetical protein